VNPQKLGPGIAFALTAYLLWGLLPAYFLLLRPAGAIEIVALRVLLALVFCAILLTVTRGWPAFLAVVRHRRSLLMMGIAAVFIAANWLGYVYASTSGLIVEGALGYFINPIVVVLLGVVVLRERLRVLQWIAIAVSAVAVVVLAIGYGAVPWIALLLAFSFGFYGLVKKLVGGTVDAVSGLTLETAWLAVPAAIALSVIAGTDGLVTGTAGTGQLAAILCAGVVTAVPLLFFASAARRLPLVYLGLTQYIAPILQFLVGVVLLHEEMPPARWVGFGIVWLALLILTVDSVRAGRRSLRAVPEPAR
jgi:chloramphenicol-sensitive protein RarD